MSSRDPVGVRDLPVSPLPRYHAGENFSIPPGAVGDYIVLVQASGALSEAELMRRYVQDVLDRNGVRVSAETVDKVLERYTAAGDSLDFDRTTADVQAPTYATQDGPTDKDRRIRGVLTGYAGLMDASFQNGVIAAVREIELPGSGALTPDDAQKLIDMVTGLKNGAMAVNNNALKESLDTLEGILKNRKDGNPIDGVAAGTAALKALAELGAASKLDEAAFDVVGKFAKGVGAPLDAVKFIDNTWKVINPNNGLSGAQRLEAATEAAENVLSIAEAFGTKTPLMVPILAIRMQAQATELGRQAISNLAERSLTDRLADGNTPPGVQDTRGSRERIDDQNARIRAFPTNTEENALGTCIRIIDTFKESSAQQRFMQYLKQRVEPDAVLDKLKDGLDPGIAPEKLKYLAEQMKGMAAGFMKAERDITQAAIVGDGAGKLLKDRAQPVDHLKNLPRSSEVVDLGKPVPEKIVVPEKPLPDFLKRPEPLGPEQLLKPLIQRQIESDPKLQSALSFDREGKLSGVLARYAAEAGFDPRQPIQVVAGTKGDLVFVTQKDEFGLSKRTQANPQDALTADLSPPRQTQSDLTASLPDPAQETKAARQV